MPKKCGHFSGKELVPPEEMRQKLRAMLEAVKEMMETFMRNGCSTNAITDRLTSFDEFNEFIGLPDVVARQERFGS